jgi:hypothetical protein
MFNLFHSIFGAATTGSDQYPDWLVDKAIERAVDGVDSRLRVIGGYKKRLRPSIIHAIDHVVQLVDNLTSPIDASRKQYGRDPCLTAFFASVEELQKFFSYNRGIRDYVDNTTGSKPDRIIGLLVMNRYEKRVFGMEMEGDMLRRDVPQVTINFDGHRLLDANGEEAETRRFLKRRAFDHLISLALADVINSRRERLELEEQRILLRRKLATYEAKGWGFDMARKDMAVTDETTDHSAAQRELGEIESQLKALPARTEYLSDSLDALINIFNSAAQKLWSVPVSMIIDRMNIKRKSISDNTIELSLQEFHSANGLILTGCMVSFPSNELLPREEFLSGVERYL